MNLTGKAIQLDADGHLANRNDWNEDMARELAAQEGIPELTPQHWAVINFMRKVFEKEGDAPSIRRLTKESGVDTKTLYQLFPKGPAKRAAKIAGLPKPKGCI
ncbi:MAG TPA: TusE/DsrC/DsvC family sulfur relay protein [Acidobacteriaceae bacterium]|nr:TusE/DsrC/DsvC family sulfur relay protein [Acidobacteriaceae bacterium]